MIQRQLRPHLLTSRLQATNLIRPTIASFSTSTTRPAISEGPPPRSFRLPEQTRWDNDKESIWDKAGNYFLMTEMVRGMWVVLEQFFRPP